MSARSETGLMVLDRFRHLPPLDLRLVPCGPHKLRALIPVPEVRVLPDPIGWQAWDAAVAQRDAR